MKNMDYADLEISLQRFNADSAQVSYTVEFRFNLPESETENRLDQGKLTLVTFDTAALLACGGNWNAYGQELTRQFFTDDVCQPFVRARDTTESQDLPLRLRLMIGPSAPELHALHWETLYDPERGGLLCSSERILFSRYLSSADWRTVRLRPKGTLRALAVVSNPADLESRFHLPSLKPADEIAKIQAGLGQIPLDTLPGTWPERHATLRDLEACLRDKEYDILYLVCHGRHLQDGTSLLLETDDGKGQPTSGSELAERLNNLTNRPRLVVLVSCESAGDGGAAGVSGGEKNNLAGVGPQLSERGIPAVIAMQSQVTFETITDFMPVFFRELDRDGIVDRAFASARSAVREEADAWVPVLFMRLKTGRLWYTPGFGEAGGVSDVWPRLMLRLKSYLTRPMRPDPVTPVIGHGLVEPVLGSLNEIARYWADRHSYPMAPYERESLPQVAQYLAINQDKLFPYQNLEETLRQELKEAFPTLVGQEDLPLDDMIKKVGAERRKDPLEAHRILAGLPLSIYLTANGDRLMEDALVEAGKQPEVILCPWFRDSDQLETVYDREKYIPSKDRPLVYHLFGRLDTPESMVLTEDDYFDYLMGVSRNKDRIPKDVLRALAASTMLFIGFQLEDWNFRVLLRSIMALADESIDRRPANIAAQIEPEEARIIEPGRARRYIEQYFTTDAKISLYWGSVNDFIRELQQRWTAGG